MWGRSILQWYEFSCAYREKESLFTAHLFILCSKIKFKLKKHSNKFKNFFIANNDAHESWFNANHGNYIWAVTDINMAT
jgi:hypothetical protein